MMFRKKLSDKKTFEEKHFKFIDLHSHVLPGIDDGAADMEASLDLVRELSANGATDIFVTPHYVDETIYTSLRSFNLELLDKLQAAVLDAGLDTRLHLGNEIYMTPRMIELIETGVVSTLGNSMYVLVELPMSGEFPGYEDILLSMLRSGYQVILAHPERYTSFADDFSLVYRLRDMGVLFQCNIGSFAGQYGKTVYKMAVRLARERMIFGVGSDIHHVHPGLLSDGLRKLSEFYKETELDEILVGNPGKIVGESED